MIVGTGAPGVNGVAGVGMVMVTVLGVAVTPFKVSLVNTLPAFGFPAVPLVAVTVSFTAQIEIVTKSEIACEVQPFNVVVKL